MHLALVKDRVNCITHVYSPLKVPLMKHLLAESLCNYNYVKSRLILTLQRNDTVLSITSIPLPFPFPSFEPSEHLLFNGSGHVGRNFSPRYP